MPDIEVKQQYLVDEVLKLNELSKELRRRILDVFVKEPTAEETKGEPPEPNPIDYSIHKTVETQHIIETCYKLLEAEIINKLEGSK